MGSEIMKIYRNANGTVINIGEWDVMSALSEDSDGNLITVEYNPLPEDILVSDEEVITLDDGGLSVEG